MRKDWLKQAEAVQLSHYSYDLPDERIARYPLAKRDESRLLVYSYGTMDHHTFRHLPDLLPSEALLVFNNTKVIPARAYFQKSTGATIEVLLLHPEQPTRIINDAMLVQHECVWECMIGNKKRWKNGDSLARTLELDGQTVILTVTYADYEQNLVRLAWDADFPFLEIVKALGQIPLPPYLNRDTEDSDIETYQTVYADQHGAVAAPTAGLHFTEQVFKALDQKGIKRSFLTLHVGAGTFQPIKADTVVEHRMHSEQVVFSRTLIGDLLENNQCIVPVGTTSLRSLESLYWFGVKLYRRETEHFLIEKLYPYPFEEAELPTLEQSLTAIADFMDRTGIQELTGETEIFIFPGYKFRMCKGLVTNYHQPGSTLILLVAALVGEDWRKIYAAAMENNYRFLSYGDSSLLWRAEG